MSLELAQVNILLRQPAATDWPNAYAIKALAYLQTWHQGTDTPTWNRTAAPWQSALHAAVERGVLPSHPVTVTRTQRSRVCSSGPWGEPVPLPPPPQQVEVAHITATDFARWLAAQGEQPSKLLAAWFKAQGVTEAATAPSPAPAAETTEQRQDRRLKMCIDAGLEMPSASVGRLPDGVGRVADLERVTRQTFSTDVKEALARKIERERPKPRLVAAKKP